MSNEPRRMSVFEIHAGYPGDFSSVHAYAWAESEDQARELFIAEYKAYPVMTVEKLFDPDAKPMIFGSEDGF